MKYLPNLLQLENSRTIKPVSAILHRTDLNRNSYNSSNSRLNNKNNEVVKYVHYYTSKTIAKMSRLHLLG